MPIESPCIQVCEIDPTSALCRGCGRTPAEIGAWLAMTPSARAAVTALLAARMRAVGLAPPPERADAT